MLHHSDLTKVAGDVRRICSTSHAEATLPDHASLSRARSSLVDALPETGLGLQKAFQHLHEDVVPALNASSQSPNYYGFVTGGATPAAVLADNLVTAFDQNVQVHLPNETIATEVEKKALILLCDLLRLYPGSWSHRTFTTGATASNVVGLACGREYIIAKAASRNGAVTTSVSELGLLGAMRCAGVEEIQILTTVPHSSLGKAASLIGLGRASVKLVGLKDANHKLDLAELERLLKKPKTVSIVAISCAEVNTGRFATGGYDEMKHIRNLCDQYGAWIHVDGAFGLFGRLLTGPAYRNIVLGCGGLELADSITGDGHKLLNVPYDCGFILSRHRNLAEDVFQNAGAAYLNAGNADIADIASPLNIGVENSRRFRALPVYASLITYGRSGYCDMLERQIQLARGIASFILEHPGYVLLPESSATDKERLESIYIIVLFRAKDDGLNSELVQRIKASAKIYVSGTSWNGVPACRFAVSNWQAKAERDLPIIKDVLDSVAREWETQTR